MSLYNRYVLGDTAAVYVCTETYGTSLLLLPSCVEVKDWDALCADSMIQVSLRGDDSLFDYSRGVSMRNSSTSLLHITEQQETNGIITTLLSDGRGNDFEHTLVHNLETNVITICVKYTNHTGKEQTLESLQSFSIGGIYNYSSGKVTTRGLNLVRMNSAWSRECRIRRDSFEHLGLEESWANYGLKCERFSQVGSMPNRGFFPFAAIEGGGFVTAAMIEAPFSWQMEVSQEKQTCSLSGGLADFETGHWRKRVDDAFSFRTHRAMVRVKKGTVDDACADLVRYQDNAHLAHLSESEKDLPVMFNEWCTSWGQPSEANISALLASIKKEGLPFKYFVIDAGWYKPDGRPWNNAGGDWVESTALFPHGIKAVAQKIRDAGMIPGIWFEFETAGRDSKFFSFDCFLLKKDGVVITSKNRRFLDLRNNDVRAYIDRQMCVFLRDNGFGYLKIDYNDTFGMGCDGSDSLGEGGRLIAQESVNWIGRVKSAVPGIVVENCASGGSRIEPYRMSVADMCSFSDAHECKEIPLVAANISRVIPARQNQIWATLRKEDTRERIVWSVSAAMFGRVCISGDVHLLNGEQIAALKEGIAFYEQIKDIVARGKPLLCDCDIESYREPVGRQVYVKESEDGNKRLVLAHFFADASDVTVDVAGFRLASSYTTLIHTVADGVLKISANEDNAGAFLLEREGV